MKSERKQASQSKAAVRNESENENEMYTWRELIKLIVLCRPAKFLQLSLLCSLSS